jgi:hypothetical protein
MRDLSAGALSDAGTALGKPSVAGSCDSGKDADWNGHPRMFCDASSLDFEGFEEWTKSGVTMRIMAFGSVTAADDWWSKSLPDYDHSDPFSGIVDYRNHTVFLGFPVIEEVRGVSNFTGTLYLLHSNLVLIIGEIVRREDKNVLVAALHRQAAALLNALTRSLEEPVMAFVDPFIPSLNPENLQSCYSLHLIVYMYNDVYPDEVTCSVADGNVTTPISCGTPSLVHSVPPGFCVDYETWNTPSPVQFTTKPTIYTFTTTVKKAGFTKTAAINFLYPKEPEHDATDDGRFMLAVYEWIYFKGFPAEVQWSLKSAGPPLGGETVFYEMTGTGGGQVAVSVLDEAVTDFDGSVNLAVLSDPLFTGEAHTLQEHGMTEINAVSGEIAPPVGSRASVRGLLDNLEYYGFFVSPLGTYRIVHHVGGVSTPVVDWTRSDAITPGYGAWNQLRMVRAGGALTFYANGILLHTIESPAFSQGIFGLYATDSDDPGNPARVQFDHIAFLGTLAEPRVKLEVQKPGSGAGTVTSTPAGISCGTDCRQYYKKNTVVTLSAAAAAGSAFTGWSGACSGTAGCTVTMDGDKTVTAQFLPTGSIVEDFSDGVAQNWEDDGSGRWSVTGGAYVMAGNKGNAKRFALYDGTFCDVRFQADMRKTAGDQPGTNYSYGLHFRGDAEDSSYYSIVIATDGKYMIGKRVDGAFTVLVNWTASPALVPGHGQWNTLTIEAVGTSLKFFSNSTLLATLEDPSLICGTVGLYAYDAASSDVPDRVEFDNVVIVPLDSGETRVLTVTKTGDGTVTAASGINCGTSCSASYPKGTPVILTATPAPGYDFAYYTGGCASVDPSCSLTLDADTTVTARFVSKKTKKVNLVVAKTRTNKGDGTVASTDGRIACGTDCREGYYPGSPVKLRATALPNSVFTSWINCPSAIGDTCTLAANKNLTVKAVFIGPYTLKVQRVLKNKAGGTVTSAGGGIACGTDCVEQYIYNTAVTLTATPDAGSTFTGWTGCDTYSGNTCTVAMNKAKTIRATFDKPRPR